MTPPTTTPPAGAAAGPLVRPAWRRLRFWLVVAAVLLVGAAAVTALPRAAADPLDPASAHHNGSKALAEVLRGYGVTVRTSRDPREVRGSVLVTVPRAWSPQQLRAIGAAAQQTVLVAPTAADLAALTPRLHPAGTVGGRTEPGCDWAGAQASGPVMLPAGTGRYVGPAAPSCYGGAVAIAGPVAVLGSGDLLRNDTVGDDGVAALDVNLLTADRTIRTVTWLLPGSAGAGQAAAPTVWALFPGGVHRAVVWLLAVGLLLAVVSARRFGPVVSEPLPVVVRAAELVEGHGRLYRRAGARDRAAAALRDGTRRRLRAGLGLPRSVAPAALVAAVADAAAMAQPAVAALLDGPPPADDETLLRLATGLAELERAAGAPRRRGDPL